MGLDMYLKRKRYIGAQYEHRNINGKIEIKKGDKVIPIQLNKISYIEEDVGYWRKANAIHKWFVDNCQEGVDDCKEYWVSREKLEELLNICKQVVDIAKLKDGKITNGYTIKEGEWQPILEDGKYITNAEEIEELLPTEDGCFFGSTDYDEYYLQDIKNTIDIIEAIFKEDDKDDYEIDYYYQSSW